MDVIFHVGYPKTASTWLQRKFFPQIVSHTYVDLAETNNIFVRVDSLGFDAAHVRNQFSGCNGVLFSSEGLVTIFKHGWDYANTFIANAQKMHATFPQAKVLLLLRRQQSMICSAYMQHVKNGGNYSLRKFLYGGRSFSFDHLMYHRVIEYYDFLFGADNVFVYLYEEFNESPQLFIRKLSEDLHIKVKFDNVSYDVVNMGLRKYMLPIMRFVNLFTKPYVGQKMFIIPLRMTFVLVQFLNKMNRYSIFGKHLNDSMLSRCDLDFISNYYKESNRQLAKRIGGDAMKKYGYYL